MSDEIISELRGSGADPIYFDIFYKTCELEKLGNRLNRYRRRLIRHSLEIIARDGKSVVLCEQSFTNEDDSHIYVICDGQDVFDHLLIKRTEKELPSLYRRHQQGQEDYEQKRQELSRLLQQVPE